MRFYNIYHIVYIFKMEKMMYKYKCLFSYTTNAFYLMKLTNINDTNFFFNSNLLEIHGFYCLEFQKRKKSDLRIEKIYE